jgi:hypothetical protein
MSVSPAGSAPNIQLLDTRQLLEPMVNAQVDMTKKLLGMQNGAEELAAQSADAMTRGGGLDVYA